MLRRALITLFALAAFMWNVAGETSDPVLLTRDLPADILNDCPVAASATECAAGPGYASRWLARRPTAELFVVMPDPCAETECRAWLVERSASGVHTLLALTGEFRFERAPSGYPSVQTRAELTNAYASYTRFEWDGSRYVRSETRLVHRVDDFECGSESECHAAARDALEHDRADRAVRIWQQVHGVAWI